MSRPGRVARAALPRAPLRSPRRVRRRLVGVDPQFRPVRARIIDDAD
ncbi:hypothetical protein ACFPM0_36790 [Pseudonocardia sulfidoxydans]